MMIEIPLTQGKVALVDDVDADLAEIRWYANRLNKRSQTFYCVRNININGKKGIELLHRVILSRIMGRELLRHEHTDHIDRNGLNNQRSNLRMSTHSQNMMNRTSWGKTSNYKGVSWYKRREKWQVVIGLNKKLFHLGYFDDEYEAHLAYCEKAKELFGEYWRAE
jgi:hypothetical protein